MFPGCYLWKTSKQFRSFHIHRVILRVDHIHFMCWSSSWCCNVYTNLMLSSEACVLLIIPFSADKGLEPVFDGFLHLLPRFGLVWAPISTFTASHLKCWIVSCGCLFDSLYGIWLLTTLTSPRYAVPPFYTFTINFISSFQHRPISLISKAHVFILSITMEGSGIVETLPHSSFLFTLSTLRGGKGWMLTSLVFSLQAWHTFIGGKPYIFTPL